MKNSCKKCTSRYVGCHSTCPDYQEFYKKNEELKKAKRLDEAEIHQIENNKNINNYLANKKKRPKRVGIW